MIDVFIFHSFWQHAVALFLVLSGFILGMGAVTVIDWLGFSARNSEYWTVATVRTHRITKPLIWIGIFLLIVGTAWFYILGDLGRFGLERVLLIIMLVINGSYLTFSISPYLLQREAEGKGGELLPIDVQARIRWSFLVSFVGWWASLILFVISFTAANYRVF